MNAPRNLSACLALLLLGCSGSSSGARAARNTITGTGGTGAQGSGGATTQASGGTSGGTGGGGADAASGSGGVPQRPPPPKVNACDGLAPEGTFEEITPAEVVAGIGTTQSDGQTRGGTFAIAVDQVNQGTVYVGTLFNKLWKTTDCGATWKAIATGTNGTDINRGMNWTLAIDPIDPNIVYTNSGYGSNGLFKSTDGGVNWTDVWSATSQPEMAKAFTYMFVNVVAIDPSDHQHVLLTFHERCLAPHPQTCIAESKDGGSSWQLIDGRPEWDGNEGQVIFFLDDSKTWLWGSQSNGFWRSGDAGGSWEAITGMTTSHLQGSQIHRRDDGAYFVAGADGIWWSPDGQASTWALVPSTGPIVGGLVSTGSAMFASTCYFPNYCNPQYLRSPESDGKQWTAIKSPTLTQGGTMGYDKAHKLLYSSNGDAGIWRVVVQ